MNQSDGGPTDAGSGGGVTDGGVDGGATDGGPEGGAGDAGTDSGPTDAGTDGGPSLTVLAAGEPSPYGITVDKAHVYWTTAGGTVMSVPLEGGTPVTLASGQRSPMYGIVVDSTDVYWTNFDVEGDATGTVMKVPLGGGTPDRLASGQLWPTGIAVDSSRVYWADSGHTKVMGASLDGGGIFTVASGQSPVSVAVDSASVYWSNDYGTGGWTIEKAPLIGGPAVTLAAGWGLPNFYGMVIDGSYVYWTVYNWSSLGDTAAIMRVPLEGGAPFTLATVPGEPYAIAVDGTAAYWSMLEPANNGSVLKVPLDGGAPVTLATGQGAVYGIAVDSNSVYWCRTTAGAVMKLTPK